MSHLANNILLIRSILNESQTRFGKRFNATKAMIISYEKDTAKPDGLFMSRLSKLSKKDINDLVEKTLSEEELEVEKEELVSRGGPSKSNTSGDLKEFLSDSRISVREYVDRINQHTDYLQGLLALSLHDLSKNQKDMYAHLKGAIKRQAERYSKMDPEKVKEELDKISTYAAEIRMVVEKEGIQRP